MRKEIGIAIYISAVASLGTYLGWKRAYNHHVRHDHQRLPSASRTPDESLQILNTWWAAETEPFLRTPGFSLEDSSWQEKDGEWVRSAQLKLGGIVVDGAKIEARQSMVHGSSQRVMKSSLPREYLSVETTALIKESTDLKNPTALQVLEQLYPQGKPSEVIALHFVERRWKWVWAADAAGPSLIWSIVVDSLHRSEPRWTKITRRGSVLPGANVFSELETVHQESVSPHTLRAFVAQPNTVTFTGTSSLRAPASSK